MFNPEDIKLIKEIVREGVTLNWLPYLFLAIIAAIASFFGAYFRKKGDYLALREEFDKILEQNKQMAKAIEQIRNDFYVSKAIHNKFVDKIVDFYIMLHKYYRSCQKVVNSSHIRDSKGAVVSTKDLLTKDLEEIKERYDGTEGYMKILLPKRITKISNDLTTGFNNFKNILKDVDKDPSNKIKLHDCFINEIQKNKDEFASALRVYFKIEAEE
ncbi:MAG: hypothetical protein PHO70_08465 [Candidatus Omnitrophica bacterium]|nr:hypothetical protein [Candidatus Omnitrophota bacterium]